MRSTRIGVVGITMMLVSATGALTATAAFADPTNARSSGTFTATCDRLGTVHLVTNGNGRSTPGLVTTSNRVLIPYRIHSEFTPTGGATQVFDMSKPAPQNGRLDRCTYAITLPWGTIAGTAWVSYTNA